MTFPNGCTLVDCSSSIGAICWRFYYKLVDQGGNEIHVVEEIPMFDVWKIY